MSSSLKFSLALIIACLIESFNKLEHVNRAELILWLKQQLISPISRYMPHIAEFLGSTWGPPGSCRTQMGLMLAP